MEVMEDLEICEFNREVPVSLELVYPSPFNAYPKCISPSISIFNVHIPRNGPFVVILWVLFVSRLYVLACVRYDRLDQPEYMPIEPFMAYVIC
jgi:hypothetical protein